MAKIINFRDIFLPLQPRWIKNLTQYDNHTVEKWGNETTIIFNWHLNIYCFILYFDITVNCTHFLLFLYFYMFVCYYLFRPGSVNVSATLLKLLWLNFSQVCCLNTCFLVHRHSVLATDFGKYLCRRFTMFLKLIGNHGDQRMAWWLSGYFC